MTKRLSVSAPAGGGEGNAGSHSLIMLKPLCGSAPRAQWASPEIVILSRHRLLATGRCLVSPGTAVFYIIAYLHVRDLEQRRALVPHGFSVAMATRTLQLAHGFMQESAACDGRC